jgi:thiamine-phosphate pyrophosphorylase
MLLAQGGGGRRVALGGMTAARWLRLRHYGFDGWAAIDGLTAR